MTEKKPPPPDLPPNENDPHDALAEYVDDPIPPEDRLTFDPVTGKFIERPEGDLMTRHDPKLGDRGPYRPFEERLPSHVRPIATELGLKRDVEDGISREEAEAIALAAEAVQRVGRGERFLRVEIGGRPGFYDEGPFRSEGTTPELRLRDALARAVAGVIRGEGPIDLEAMVVAYGNASDLAGGEARLIDDLLRLRRNELERVLRAQWTAVLAVAAGLAEHGSLTQAEVLALMKVVH